MLLQKMRSLLFLSIVCLGLSSCSSGSGDNELNGLPGAPQDTTEPLVQEYYPEMDQEDVEVDESARVVFSELMDEMSLKNGGIQLFSGREDDETGALEEERRSYLEFSEIPGVGQHPVTGQRQDILVSVVNLQAEKKRFALGNTYTVRVFDTSKDLAGNPKIVRSDDESDDKETIRTFSFIVEDGTWQKADLLQVDVPDSSDASNPPLVLTGDVFDPALASNSDGDTLAVWRQSEVKNGVARILASRYSADNASWGSVESQSVHTAMAEFLDQDLETSAYSPEIAVNRDGIAAVVWHQAPMIGAISSIWINVYDCDRWLGPTNVLAATQLAGNIAHVPKVVVADNGDIILAWREFDSSESNNKYRIKAGRYQIEHGLGSEGEKTCNVQGLSTESILTSDASGDAGLPQLEISSRGDAFLVWPQMIVGEQQQIHVSRYNQQTGWSSIRRIDASDLDEDSRGNASAPVIAVDDNNDGFAVWQQFDGKRENIWISRFSGGAWGSASLLETDNRGDATEPHVVIAQNGKAFAIWHQDLGSNVALNLKSYSPDTGWGSIEQLAGASGTSVFSRPRVQFDREGNAIAMWVVGSQSSGTVSASRYSKESGKWTLAPAMNNYSLNSQGLVFEPLLEDGRMRALWYHFDGAAFGLASALFGEQQ